jgi:hypothetical protein
VAALPVFIAVAFWAAVFMIFFAAQGLTPGEFFFGRYEPPPPDLGEWKETATAAGLAPPAEVELVHEERLLLPEGRTGAGYFLHQARYRDPVTRAIVRVEPERRVRRRRVSAR